MMASTSKSPEKEAESPRNHENVEEVEEEEIIVVAGEETVEEGGIEVVDEEEIIYAEDDEEYAIEYDALVSVSTEKNVLFDLYQPHETQQGTFVCKICMRTGKNTEYPDRQSFVAHRYKFHGSFNNNVICPIMTCREVYASLYTLRRHLSQHHQLPVEIHVSVFQNIGEFEKHRHLIELASGCRYMMHTKQPKYRRQVMHCAKSEHKLVLQTQKHRLPRERMEKEGAACPSVISYRVDPNSGQVYTFSQLFHVGHAPDPESEIEGNVNSARPMDVVFPVKPPFWAERPMQYVQIDVHDMPTAVYGNKMYESILVMTCVKTRFMWARPLIESTRTAIGRILNSIFNEFGVPEGFSTTYHPTYIRDTMKALESVYEVEIREIWSEPPPYSSLEQWIMEISEIDLGTRNRWVEQMSFVVMEYNQRTLVEIPGGTPFEKMFGRKAPNLYQNGDHDDQKVRKFHLELRKEDSDVVTELGTEFKVTEKVFLRKGITKPRRGNNSQFYFGIIGEFDPNNKYYPYKVHFSSTDAPWPSDRNMFVWVSVFDLLPTIHQVSEMKAPDRREAISELLCTCDGVLTNKNFDLSAIGKLAHESSKCLLFRNPLCSNHMSKYCCKLNGSCQFHNLYPENDESYARMDLTIKEFNQQRNRHEKINKKHQESGPTREMMRDEIHSRRLQGDAVSDYEDVYNEEDDDVAPTLEKMEKTVTEEMAIEHSDMIEIDEIEEEIIIPAEGSSEHPDADYEYEPKKLSRKRKNSETEEKSKKDEPSTSSFSSRRASSRRPVRPKNFDDYVE